MDETLREEAAEQPLETSGAASEVLLVRVLLGAPDGQGIKIGGLGVFTRRRKAAREGRNPHTGESIRIAGRTLVVARRFVMNPVPCGLYGASHVRINARNAASVQAERDPALRTELLRRRRLREHGKGQAGEMNHLKGRKIGEILVAMGLLDAARLREALEYATAWLCPLGQACIELGYFDDRTLTRALAVQLGAPAVDLRSVEPGEDVLRIIDPRTAAERRVIPLAVIPNANARPTLVVAVSNPKNSVLDELAFATGHRISPVLASDADIDAALVRLYRIDPTTGTDDTVDLSAGPGLEHVIAGYLDLGTPEARRK